MPSVQSVAALVALYQAVSASPAVPLSTRDAPAFRINQVSAGFKAYQPPAVGLLQTYNKYAKVSNVTVPPTVVQAAAAQQSGAVTATPEVTIGGQTLNLDFDTGSSDLWVFSTLQASSQTTGHKLYNPNDGTSKLKSGYTWSISYGDGSSAGGNVYADKVVVGPVTASSQAVEAATSASASFSQDTTESGLLGLAFSTINTVQPQAQTTFFDTVKSTLAKKLFTADLKKGQPGSYDFGFIDTSKYTGSITYTAVDSSQGFWGFTVNGANAGDTVTSTTKISAIADTGTSLLLLDSATVSAYYAKVPGSSNSATYGGYVFSCSTTLPDFSVKIGSTTFTVPGSYINYAPLTTGTNAQCYGGIQSNSGLGFSIFGDIFLKNFFVVFSQVGSSPQIGFAKQ